MIEQNLTFGIGMNKLKNSFNLSQFENRLKMRKKIGGLWIDASS